MTTPPPPPHTHPHNVCGRVSHACACSCPAGFKSSGSQCVNENECQWFPCQNGGRCRDHSPPKKYECLCPAGFTGLHCELELLASGVLTPSRDFFIALLICASSLIRK